MNLMNKYIIAILSLVILLVGIVGYISLTVDRTLTPPAQQTVFVSQEECEQKTGESCNFQICDYVPPGKTFEEVCGKDFKKGWISDKTTAAILVVPEGEAKKVQFEKIELHNDWRLTLSHIFSPCKGVLRREDELKEIWEFMINVYNELQAPWEKKNENQPVMPVINFSKHSVIWYADQCGNASFTNMKEVIEYDNYIQAQVVSFHSDFGSSNLNLWIIPKTDKEIRFIETKKYEQRSG